MNTSSTFKKIAFAVILMAVSVIRLQAAATTYTFSGTTSGTYNWSAGTNWSPAPAGNLDGTLTYSGNLAPSAAIVSNNDLAGNFLLNRLTFGNGGTAPAGTLTLQGGTLEFVNNSSAVAPTLSVNLGGSGPAITINNNILLTNSLSMTFNNAATIGGAISGAGDLIKTNTSTTALTLTASNGYTGATIIGTSGSAVGASTLILGGANGAITASSGISINGVNTNASKLILDNATTANSNRIGDSVGVTVATGGDLNLVGNGGTSSVTENIGTLTLGTGNSFVSLSGSGASQLVTLNAAAFSRTGNATGLIRATNLGQQATNAGRLTLNSTSGLTLVGTSSTSGTKNLKIVPYLLGETSATGTGVATTAGFMTYDSTNGLRPLASGEYTTLSAGYAATDENVKSFNGTITASGPTVNSLLIQGSNVLNGSGALTVTSGAVATNNATSNNTAAITGFSGLALGNGEGVLNVNGYLNVNVPISVTSSGGLTKGGTGTLVLNASNSYTGGTTVNSGTLVLGNGTLSGDLGSGTATVQPQGTIALNLPDGSTVSNAIVLNGGGNITRAASTSNLNTLTGGISGTGGITLNVAGSTLGLSTTQLTNTGATTVSNGALRVTGNVLSTSSAFSLTPADNTGNAILQLRADTNTTFQNGTATFTSANNGAANSRTATINVDQTTAGNTGKTLTLDGAFTVKNYQNNTATLNVTGGNGYGLALGQLVGSSWDSSGGTVALNVTAPGGLNLASLDVAKGSTLFNFTGSTNTVIAGNITRSANNANLTVQQSGSGELTLQGSSSTIVSSAGSTTGYIFNLNSGKLNVNNAAALGDGGSLTNSSYSRTLNISGGTLDNTSGGNLVVLNNLAATNNRLLFTTNIEGNFTYGSTDPNSKGLTLNVGSSATGANQRGYISLGTSAGTSRTITTNGSSFLALNGAIVNGTTANSIVKDGAASLVLGNTNFYSGGTTVNNGTLEVNGDSVAAQSGVSGTTSTTTTNSANFTVTGLSAGVVSNLRVGQAVTGTNIPAGAIITGKLSTTSVAISVGATGTGTVSNLAFGAGGGLGTGAVSVTGGTLLVNSTGDINSTTGVSVTGGTFKYDGTTALNRDVTLNGGKFSYNSVNNYAGTLTFTSGTIGGSNISNLDLTINTGKTMSPGNSTGTMTAGATTWATGGTFLFELNDTTGTAGSTSLGWDLLNAASLNITAGVGEFTIQIASLDNLQAAGNALNFDGSSNYTWLFVDAGAPITGFNASSFNLDDSAFANATPGTFSITQGTGGDVDKLYINYTGVIPEPSTYAMLIGGLGLLAFLRRRKQS